MGKRSPLVVMNPCRLVDVLLWAIFLPNDPSIEQIRHRWGVSRATAFRWRTLLAESRVKAAVIVMGMAMEVPRT